MIIKESRERGRRIARTENDREHGDGYVEVGHVKP
jgi:hypothetical protein